MDHPVDGLEQGWPKCGASELVFDEIGAWYAKGWPPPLGLKNEGKTH